MFSIFIALSSVYSLDSSSSMCMEGSTQIMCYYCHVLYARLEHVQILVSLCGNLKSTSQKYQWMTVDYSFVLSAHTRYVSGYQIHFEGIKCFYSCFICILYAFSTL